MKSSFNAFREKHHFTLDIAFFFAGFLFDVLLLHRIDSVPLLIHQGTYLLLSSALIFWDHRILVSGKEPQGWVAKLASYRLWAMHFFLGTLLNAFMVFYFRASSGFMSFCFLVALAFLIVINELPQFRSRGPVVRVMLLSFSVTSFSAYLLPVIYGELRAWQYMLSVFIGTAATFGLWKLFTRFTHDPNWTFERAVMPGLGIQILLLLLYLANVIPPVPLSLKYIDVYYSVQPHPTEKGVPGYSMKYAPTPVWKFWDKHSDTLKLKEGAGEKVYIFTRIFAPTKFRDQISFQWQYSDPQQGWANVGTPFKTTLGGGNENGYRTYASMTSRMSGAFRVLVKTADGREIGRKTFDIELSQDIKDREMVEEEE